MPAMGVAPVNYLDTSYVKGPQLITSVNLTPLVSRGESRSDSGSSAPTSLGQTGMTLPPTGTSLADQLRIVLAAPLDSLLPGPLSALEWPGDLMPFQRDGVRTLMGAEKLLLADDMGLARPFK